MALYIHHNPGLGDAIVCNGLVHHFRKRASTPPIVAIKKNHAYSVQQLYRHSAVVIDEVANDQEAFEHSQAHDLLRVDLEWARSEAGKPPMVEVAAPTEDPKKTYQWGLRKWNKFREVVEPSWEKSMYEEQGLDYSLRYEGFELERNLEREGRLSQSLNLPKEYALSHTNDCSLGVYGPLVLDTKKPVIKVWERTASIFDWIGVILGAAEIHVADSAFFQLVKQVDRSIEAVEGRKVLYDIRDLVPRSPLFREDLQGWEIRKGEKK